MAAAVTAAALTGLLVIGAADPALAAPTPSPTPSAGSSSAPGTTSPEPPDTKVAEAAAAKARAAADLAGEKLGLARQAAADAERMADAARADASRARAVADASLAALEEMARRDYMNGQVTPGLGWLVLAGSADDPLSALRAVGQLDLATQDQAGIVARASRDARVALQAQREAATASARAADAATKAEQAKTQLDEAAARAADVLAAARERDVRVAAEQAREAAAAAAAAGTAGHDRSTWLGQAAQDLRARALAAGAATARELDAADGDAALLATAANALLEQASGRRAASPTGPSPAAPGPGLTFHPDGYPHSPAAAAHDSQALAPAAHPLPGLDSGGVGLDGTSPWGHVAAPLLAANGVTVAPTIPDPPRSADAGPLAASVAVTAALRELGTPYVWAASGPTTFDCSGLMLWAWGQAGVRLDHFSGAQWDQGRPVSSPDQLLPGDLLLFATPDSGIHHVAMYLGAGWMVHAPRSGTYVTVAPVATMGDQLIGAVRP